jgi:aspartate ammonia-lyase
MKKLNKKRIESDFLGSMEIPVDALYGIHTLRSVNNFPLSGRKVVPALIHAFGYVKMACATANYNLDYLKKDIYDAIFQACGEMSQGKLDEHIIVDALQGGAGTSTNMNVNEVIANRALQIIGEPAGSYHIISPIDTVNLHQSTNDTYPTALKVAAIFSIKKLEQSLICLLESFQKKEKEFAHIVKVARTQMQDAVLITLGREMGAYAEAVGRDRWRVFKCEERLKVINLGGTAVGTGIGAPRQYIFKATDFLRKFTALSIARGENLVESTQNIDSLVEVSGILNATAVNLMKIASDLRLISSGPEAGLGEIKLPAVQAGSSIMPGKVNPVIPEAVTQAALTVMANNTVITQAAAMGTLELNPFMPLIADKLLESILLLEKSCLIFAEKCVDGIIADEEKCKKHVNSSTALITALISEIGYSEAQKIINTAEENSILIKDAAVDYGFISEEKFNTIIQPEVVNRLGSKGI